MDMLTSRERILRTVAGQPVDRIPIFAPLHWHSLRPQSAPGSWKAKRNYQDLAQLSAVYCDCFAQLQIRERVPFRDAPAGYGMGGVPEGIFDRRFLLVPPETVEFARECDNNILAHGAGPIVRFGGCEQATPPMMSNRLFRELVLAYEAPLWRLVREAGQIVWVHCHGRIASVFDSFNGFFHYFPRGNAQFADDNPRQSREVRVAGARGEKIWWPMALSNHMSIEGGPMLQLAVNEMLLQSYSGVIRVFPAVPPQWEGQFRLHAVARFGVSAARTGGDVLYVVIESMGGEPCRMANPWPGQAVTLHTGTQSWQRVAELTGEMLAFDTQPDSLYLLLPEGRLPSTLPVAEIGGQPNMAAKTLGTARLGMAKGF